MKTYDQFIQLESQQLSKLDRMKMQDFEAFLEEIIDFVTHNCENEGIVDEGFATFRKWSSLYYKRLGVVFAKNISIELHNNKNAISQAADQLLAKKLTYHNMLEEAKSMPKKILTSHTFATKMFSSGTQKRVSLFSLHLLNQFNESQALTRVLKNGFDSFTIASSVVEIVDYTRSKNILNKLSSYGKLQGNGFEDELQFLDITYDLLSQRKTDVDKSNHRYPLSGNPSDALKTPFVIENLKA